MWSSFKNFFDKSILSYAAIGMTNVVFTMGLEFLLHNVFGWDYWWFTSVPFMLTSISSFIFNRRFSFHGKGNVWFEALKFYIIFALCFLLAFKLAQPISKMLLSDALRNVSETRINNISIVVGQCVFTPLNYTGQRYIVFRKKRQPPADGDAPTGEEE